MKVLLSFCFLMVSMMVNASPLADFKKIGHAKLEVLFWDIYESELYSPSGVFEPDTYPLALKIRYLRNIKASSLVERTGDEWQKLGFSDAQTNTWLGQIENLWPDIRKGDELLLVINQAGQSEFYYNDSKLGTLTDTSFGPGFAAIWLDKNCSYPELREQLIGESE